MCTLRHVDVSAGVLQVSATSLVGLGGEGAGAEANPDGRSRDSETMYVPCIAGLPTPGVEAKLTAMWSSGAGCTTLDFLAGGKSSFLMFGGKKMVALPCS
jgi:hypothetical protein